MTRPSGQPHSHDANGAHPAQASRPARSSPGDPAPQSPLPGPEGLRAQELIIVDGACGTNLQEMEIPDAAWDGREGCNELLNLTAPGVIRRLHRDFIEAGAQLLETNTFGATGIVLAEYGLAAQTREINAAAVANARTAWEEAGATGWVGGSMGPTTKLVSLGHVSAEALAAAYREQAEALVEAGADCLIIETCQDLLQVKTAVLTALDVIAAAGRDVPLLVSVTIETTGTMLVGSDIGAVCATLEPFPILSLGLNCASGPPDMESHIRYLSKEWPGRISCVPNQGLPEVEDGRTVYRLNPQDFAAQMRAFVERYGVSIAGGCCGSTPAHIRALAEALRGVRPAQRTVS